MRLYFAHGFENRKNGKELQKVIESTWEDIELINPFYSRDRNEVLEIDQGIRERYDVDPKHIVDPDLDLIDSADGLFGWIDENVEYGTSMEIFYTSEVLNRPVILLVTNKKEKHPWLRYCADYIATDNVQLQKAMDLLLKEFK